MIKVKRAEQEIEIDEKDIQDGDVKVESGNDQNKNGKTFTQDELNKFLADERRKEQKKLSDLQKSFDDFKNEVTTERTSQEEKIKTKIEEMKKGLPENITALLGKLLPQEQLEWLEANPVEKKNLPETPKGNGDVQSKPKSIGTIF